MKPNREHASILSLVLGVALLTCACAGSEEPASAAGKGVARAAIQGRAGTQVKGEAKFAEVAGGLQVNVYLEGAPPGEHAVHLHESGDCSAPDFKSAGDHFNPDAVAHGAPGSAVHHPGDFGNLEVDEKGFGTLSLTSPVLTIAPGKYCVIGRAVIVHDKPDDFGQPTGNAGGRVGCGVVQ